MAGGWSRDGAVQDQIDASVEDEVCTWVSRDSDQGLIRRSQDPAPALV
ncbi:hypothetical protein MTMN5_03906 [Marinobacter salarius]|nr:hypothetical protein MTMN5_03906 [Marinobacter salarius]